MYNTEYLCFWEKNLDKNFVDLSHFVKFAKTFSLQKIVSYGTEPEPADLQWSGQKFELDYNLLMCYGITSLSILWSLEIHTI